MKRTVFLLIVGGMLLAGTAAGAHHSFAATYYEDKLEMIEGEIVQFLYRNPHSFVHVMAPDKDGKMQALVDRVGCHIPVEPAGRGALYAQDRRSACRSPARRRATRTITGC